MWGFIPISLTNLVRYLCSKAIPIVRYLHFKLCRWIFLALAFSLYKFNIIAFLLTKWRLSQTKIIKISSSFYSIVRHNVTGQFLSLRELLSSSDFADKRFVIWWLVVLWLMLVFKYVWVILWHFLNELRCRRFLGRWER